MLTAPPGANDVAPPVGRPQVYLTFAIVLYVRLIKTSVLPWIFVSFWGDLTEPKRTKLVACFVAFNVRIAGVIVLLPAFLTNFGVERGLEFAATGGPRCDMAAADRTNAAGFYAASCWLVTLLIWEVNFLSDLQVRARSARKRPVCRAG